MRCLTVVGPGPPAEKPAGRDYLNFSSIGTFAACPLRYIFRYVACLPEEVVSASLGFGLAFHAGLEHHFRELLAGNQPPDVDTLLSVFWDAWRDNAADRTVHFPRGDDLSTLGNLARHSEAERGPRAAL